MTRGDTINAPIAADPARRRAWVWPTIVVLLLSGSVFSGVITAVIASRNQTGAVERDYYAKSLRWDETMRARDRSAALEWNAAASIGELGESEPGGAIGHPRPLSVTLTTRDGVPLAGARVHAEVFHIAHRGEAVQTVLGPDAGGAGANYYSTIIDAPWTGRYRINLSIDRGPDHFVRTIDLVVEDHTPSTSGAHR